MTGGGKRANRVFYNNEPLEKSLTFQAATATAAIATATKANQQRNRLADDGGDDDDDDDGGKRRAAVAVKSKPGPGKRHRESAFRRKDLGHKHVMRTFAATRPFPPRGIERAGRFKKSR